MLHVAQAILGEGHGRPVRLPAQHEPARPERAERVAVPLLPPPDGSARLPAAAGPPHDKKPLAGPQVESSERRAPEPQHTQGTAVPEAGPHMGGQEASARRRRRRRPTTAGAQAEGFARDRGHSRFPAENAQAGTARHSG
jgi:hypothetical protein